MNIDFAGVLPSFSALLTLSLILVALTLAKPELISVLHGEYLRLFTVTLVFCVILNTTLFLLAQTNVITKEKGECEICSVKRIICNELNSSQVMFVHRHKIFGIDEE